MQELAKAARERVAAASTLDELQRLKVEFLGKKGAFTEILKSLGALAPEERKNVGKEANDLKMVLLQSLERQEEILKKKAVEERLVSDRLDMSLNGVDPLLGHHHPVMQVFEQSKEIFRGLGFDLCDGPEIETEHYNFTALNMPENHPARDMQDTFYLPDGRVLRTHTSPVQIRVMERQKPPIAMVAPGVVYRCDSDQTHTPMFHQIEGLLVDKHIHFGHLKGIVALYLKTIFARDLKFRFRSSFFPFTEPSAEVDMTCVSCSGQGCRLCKMSGWLEIMGCGMVDPHVFNAVGIDARVFSGFAFGAGLDRIAMLKFGIPDLRLLFDNDIRFLEQF